MGDGHYYEFFQVKYEPFTYYSHTKEIRLYMGMGLTSGIFTHLYEGDLDCFCFKDLVCMYDAENKLVYQNPLFDEDGKLSQGIAAVQGNAALRVISRDDGVEFTVSDVSCSGAEELVIYDVAGHVRDVFSMEKGRVKLSDLPVGVYVYQFRGEKGKFVVEK